ncbi:hypothetical protein HU200_020247 [Digitaria exilis]|uniref:Uncharacterized protein n=1 Tax=Digitaria exilis TaxID=1010633 RepID=A0A835F1I3_9POAL|nr:hypothetical protein HU200_020247 [Digitaria exilis]
MVVLRVKSAAPAASSSPPGVDVEGTEFLYECAASAAVADVAAALGALAGLQDRLLSLCRRLRGEGLCYTQTETSLTLALGLTRRVAAYAICSEVCGCWRGCGGRAREGARRGRGLRLQGQHPPTQFPRAYEVTRIIRCELRLIFQHEQVKHNRFLSPRALREHIKNIKKKCATTLQEPPEALGLPESSSDSKHEGIQLWWAGKELSMDQKLCDYIGVNDKTKIVVKLTRARDER